MLLKKRLIKEGDFFFKYRGQLPVILILFSLITNYFFTFQLGDTLTRACQIICLILIFFGHFIRATTVGKRFKHSSGRNRSHHFAENLNCTGWYSVSRNPLYFANFCIWLGLAFFTYNPLIILLTVVFFSFIYQRIILSEEDYLINKFGETYVQWAEKIPVFFPKFNSIKRNEIPISYRTIIKNEYPGISATMTCLFLMKLSTDISINKVYQFDFWQVYVALGISFFALSMKFIKHYTTFFKLED